MTAPPPPPPPLPPRPPSHGATRAPEDGPAPPPPPAAQAARSGGWAGSLTVCYGVLMVGSNGFMLLALGLLATLMEMLDLKMKEAAARDVLGGPEERLFEQLAALPEVLEPLGGAASWSGVALGALVLVAGFAVMARSGTWRLVAIGLLVAQAVRVLALVAYNAVVLTPRVVEWQTGYLEALQEVSRQQGQPTFQFPTFSTTSNMVQSVLTSCACESVNFACLGGLAWLLTRPAVRAWTAPTPNNGVR